MRQATRPEFSIDAPSDNENVDEANPLRLWLRMYATSTIVEAELSRRLRSEFSITLPRFDLLAQLHKAGEPLSLGEISRRLMVTNGNVTGLVERLVEDGLVERRSSDSDKRSTMAALTQEGRHFFDKVAQKHSEWVAELFGDLSPSDRAHLSILLRMAKESVVKSAA
ncbi:MAG: MarR family transcriptional regulator [Devosia sp.]